MRQHTRALLEQSIARTEERLACERAEVEQLEESLERGRANVTLYEQRVEDLKADLAEAEVPA
jgi:phage shock protein A